MSKELCLDLDHNEEDKNTLAYSAGHNGAARTFDPEPAGSPRRIRVGQNRGGGPIDCERTEDGNRVEIEGYSIDDAGRFHGLWGLP